MGTLGVQEVAALLSPNKPDTIRVTELLKTGPGRPQLHDPATAGSNAGTPPQTLSTAGMKLAAARPDPPDRSPPRIITFREDLDALRVDSIVCPTFQLASAHLYDGEGFDGNRDIFATFESTRNHDVRGAWAILTAGSPGNCTSDHHFVSLG